MATPRPNVSSVPTHETVRQRLVSITALLFAGFHLYTAAFGAFPPFVQRGVHVGLALFLIYVRALRPGPGRRHVLASPQSVAYAAMACLALIASFYVAVEDERLSTTIATATLHELVLGGTLLVLCLDTARRDTGASMPIFAGVAVLYTIVGHRIPGAWGHSEISLEFLLEFLYLGSEGIWGPITGLSARLLAVIVLFGALLLATGAGETFIKLALMAAGRSPGGGAQMANIASALFGMINGSSVANVATVGTLSIPFMKRLGYRPSFAAAVEAVSSTGGQLTPPVMGAAAFLMAELVGTSYLTIAAAAVIPSILFYVCVWATIRLVARRDQMRGLDPKDIPSWRAILNWRDSGTLGMTLVVLFVSMFSGHTIVLAAFYAIATNVTLFMVLGSWNWPELKSRLRRVLKGAEAGALSIVSLVPLMVCAQIFIALINLTGIGIKVSELILSLGEGLGLLPAVLLTYAVALVLGLALPTTGAYLLTAAVCAAPLIAMGSDTLIAHFFILYGAALSGLTPPVCASVFAAAALAETDWWTAAVESLRLAVMKFVLPLMFIYRPELLLQGSPISIAWTSGMGLVASMLFAAGTVGYYHRPIAWPLRAVCIVSALAVISGSVTADLFGIGLLVGLVLFQRLGGGEETGRGVLA